MDSPLLFSQESFIIDAWQTAISTSVEYDHYVLMYMETNFAFISQRT